MSGPGIVLLKLATEHQDNLFAKIWSALRKNNLPFCVAEPGEPLPPPPAVLIRWGWMGADELRSAGYDILVFEHAYLGNRTGEWVSIAWNGLNGYGDFRLPGKVTGQRFNRYFGPYQPWRTNRGQYCVILGQLAKDQSIRGIDLAPVYGELAARLEQIHGLPVYFRRHPKCSGGLKPKIPHLSDSEKLDDVLAHAHLAAAFNSNSLVDAVMRGTPALALDRGTMAWPVCAHHPDEGIVTPCRKQWAARLAHCQFTYEEIESGEWVPRYFKSLLF